LSKIDQIGMLLELVELIKTIAIDAGEEILKIYADEDSFGVELKSDDSPLTKADKAANKVIVEGLQKLEVAYPIISEEEKQVAYEMRKDYSRFWLVDPLDGTKEFIKRNGEFTVNIALVEDGIPILGVVLVPVSGEMYWATKNNGAFYQSGDVSKQLEAPSFSMKDKGLRVVCSRSHINEETKSFIDQLDSPETVSKGSSLKFLLMAANEAEIYPRMGPTMEWDTGAAQIVLEEAGGAVLHHETGKPLIYNKENLLNPYFIARATLVDE
jgi:3'(2'), 5'-bisphosphate nucleotidase